MENATEDKRQGFRELAEMNEGDYMTMKIENHEHRNRYFHMPHRRFLADGD